MRLFAAVLALWYVALSVTPPPQAPPSGLGVSVAWQRGDAVADAVLESLSPPVYHNWIFDHMGDRRFYPMAYSLRPSAAQQYIDAAADMPGRFWLLGSEPECCSTQIDPAEAAAFVQRWQVEVGDNYACCGLMLYAPGTIWEDWLGAYLAANGPMPPYWNLHMFQGLSDPLSEFEAWMTAHDAVRPITLTEVAAPYMPTGPLCSAEYNVRYMDYVARLWATGRIRAAFWYSAPGDLWKRWPCTDLMDWDATQLTPLGEHLLSVQPGGINDPLATPTPTLEPTAEEELGQPRRFVVWLPRLGAQ